MLAEFISPETNFMIGREVQFKCSCDRRGVIAMNGSCLEMRRSSGFWPATRIPKIAMTVLDPLSATLVYFFWGTKDSVGLVYLYRSYRCWLNYRFGASPPHQSMSFLLQTTPSQLVMSPALRNQKCAKGKHTLRKMDCIAELMRRTYWKWGFKCTSWFNRNWQLHPFPAPPPFISHIPMVYIRWFIFHNS